VGYHSTHLPTTEAVCVLQKDEMIIEQHLTQPLSKRHILRNSSDESKVNGDSRSAGGFGVGFKDAATELISRGDNYGLMWQWWCTQDEAIYRVTWNFTKVGHASFSDEVENISEAKIQVVVHSTLKKMPFSSPTMVQKIRFPDIASKFWTEVVPKISWFYACPGEKVCKCIRPTYTNLIADGRTIDPLQQRDPFVRPKAGVYIRGLWVEKPQCFPPYLCLNVNNKRLPSSSTRNSVKLSLILKEFIDILLHADKVDWLRGAMQFLSSGVMSFDSTFDSSGNSTVLQCDSLWEALMAANPRAVLALCESYAFPDCGQKDAQLWVVDASDAKHESWAIDHLKQRQIPVYVLPGKIKSIVRHCAIRNIAHAVIPTLDLLDTCELRTFVRRLLTKLATVVGCTSLHETFADDVFKVYLGGVRPRLLGRKILLLPTMELSGKDILGIFHAFHSLANSLSGGEPDYHYLNEIHYHWYSCHRNRPDASISDFRKILDIIGDIKIAANENTANALKRRLLQQTAAPVTEEAAPAAGEQTRGAAADGSIGNPANDDGGTDDTSAPAPDREAPPAQASTTNTEVQTAELFETITKLALQGQEIIERNVRQRTV